ncbi:cx9C motif-containing protein 4 isoform X1 [Zonotrichia leucophrys gambelii]|uniref:cx9C motif-containing protein 4 isoform X1 n=2 Tax=Passerellidae TaxID=1729112 RepID=UPI0006B827CB|nr:cx9C motif-containing protein 4 isoform X1 [Zonotrichia albicollis]XP_014120793.1 cx9C motif-containing protein 4 isoform X1 [Zonotrichia albicollis]XP_014120794.1 cx9C motif-containing protein 4 isoform X1 [Zonotrichia albicollis]XP_026647683.1 cx9C motif-containing protein 4 isoform X1 [Zonotrichia albicollis]
MSTAKPGSWLRKRQVCALSFPLVVALLFQVPLPVTACSVCYSPPGGSLMVLKNCCLNSCLGINLFLNMSRKDPCQKQACEIQKCLQANNYVESKCEAALQEMRKCCARFTKGRSVCCSGFEREEMEREKAKLTSKGISPPPQ